MDGGNSGSRLRLQERSIPWDPALMAKCSSGISCVETVN